MDRVLHLAPTWNVRHTIHFLWSVFLYDNILREMYFNLYLIHLKGLDICVCHLCTEGSRPSLILTSLNPCLPLNLLSNLNRASKIHGTGYRTLKWNPYTFTRFWITPLPTYEDTYIILCNIKYEKLTHLIYHKLYRIISIRLFLFVCFWGLKDK